MRITKLIKTDKTWPELSESIGSIISELTGEPKKKPPRIKIRNRLDYTLEEKRAYPRLFGIWRSIFQRCYGRRNKFNARYQDRGIKVCGHFHKFYNFILWTALSNEYHHNRTLDRIDNDGNYEPSNLRWTTKSVQSRNTHRRIEVTYRGQTKCLKQMCQDYSMPYQIVYQRHMRYGWTIEDAIEKPVGKQGQRR